MSRAKQYSVYQKIVYPDRRTEWIGTHRLPISAALKAFREFRERGNRAAIRLDGEPSPSYKD